MIAAAGAWTSATVVTPLAVLWAAAPPGDADPASGKGPEWGKAAPIGLLIWLLMGLALFLLIKSMNRHLRRVPASFDGPAAGSAEGPVDGSVDGRFADGGDGPVADGGDGDDGAGQRGESRAGQAGAGDRSVGDESVGEFTADGGDESAGDDDVGEFTADGGDGVVGGSTARGARGRP